MKKSHYVADEGNTAVKQINQTGDMVVQGVSINLFEMIDSVVRRGSVKSVSARTSPPLGGCDVREYPRVSGNLPMQIDFGALAVQVFESLGVPYDTVELYAERTGLSCDESAERLASLLTKIHEVMVRQGVTHINHSRVSADVRRVWKLLMDPEILAVLPDDKRDAIEAFNS